MRIHPTDLMAAYEAAWNGVCARPPKPVLWPVFVQKAATSDLCRLGLEKHKKMVEAVFESDFNIARSFWLGSGKRMTLEDVPPKTKLQHKELVEFLQKWSKDHIK